jgi:hypothetical protein
LLTVTKELLARCPYFGSEYGATLVGFKFTGSIEKIKRND